MRALSNPYSFGNRFDPETQQRVNQVGVHCKKCTTEEWHPAPGPGWGRRIFKNRGWHLGNSANSHLCPKCVAKKHGKKTPVTVIAAPPRAFVAAELQPQPFNTALAEKLAPVKDRIVAQGFKVQARGKPYGFSQRSSAAAAARKFLTNTMGVRNPQEDTHYRTVHDLDGTYSYVLVGTMAVPKLPEADAMPAPTPRHAVRSGPAPNPTGLRRPGVFKGAGRAPVPPGAVRNQGPGIIRKSAKRYLKRAFGVADAQEGADFRLVQHDRGWSYELIGREPLVFPTLDQTEAPKDSGRPRGWHQTPEFMRSIGKQPAPPGSPKQIAANAVRSATAWLRREGVENPTEGVDFRVLRVGPPGPGEFTYEVQPFSDVPSYVRGQRTPRKEGARDRNPPVVWPRGDGSHPNRSNSPEIRMARLGKPEVPRKTHRSNIRHSAKRYIALTQNRLGAVEGVDFETYETAPGWWAYRALTPIADPISQQETPEVSDASTQAVRDAEEAARAPKPREVTFADKRTIRTALDEFYDEDNQRYRGDWSDHTLAEKLKMPRAWVSTVRDTYGPDKNDSERLKQEAELMALQQKLARLNSLADEAKKIADTVLDLAVTLDKKLDEIRALEAEVAARVAK